MVVSNIQKLTQECGDVGNFLFKICQRGQNVVRQTDATARHSNDDKEIIFDFCLISLCSAPIILRNYKNQKKKKKIFFTLATPGWGSRPRTT